MEADLSRYYHLDYRDRWRRDSDGRRILTLRMIAVRLRALPTDSACMVVAGSPGWRLEHYLAADLFHAATGKPHPMLPVVTPAANPARDKRIREARARAASRRLAIETGQIT